MKFKLFNRITLIKNALSKCLVSFVLLLSSSTITYSQEPNLQSITKSHKLISEQGYEYEILVTIPPYYDSTKIYQVLYYLDAWWLEDVVKGSYNLLNRAKVVEDIILVGINIYGDLEKFTIQRTRDYTPNAYGMNFPFIIPIDSKSYRVDSTNSGQADVFKHFLREKVFPIISKNYNVDNDNKGFLGHSFGGLFGVYDAFDKSPLFQKHIVIAPSLWWNKSFNLYEKIDSNFESKSSKANIFICYGESESFTTIKAVDNLTKHLEDDKFYNVKYSFRLYKDEDHVSILPKSIYDGIEYFYKK